MPTYPPLHSRDHAANILQHQPGKLVGNDAVPEFEAQTLPPGSAPASKTFQPNVTPSAGPDQTDFEGHPAAGDMGSTSADVHTGLGHPGAGQSSAELHDNTQARQGLEGAGAKTVLQSDIDTKDPKFAEHRVIHSDVAETGRGNVGGPSAEERVPESAQTVAKENKLDR